MIPQTDFSSKFEILADGSMKYTNAYASYNFGQPLPLKKLEGDALTAARDRLQDQFETSLPSIKDKETTQAEQIKFFKKYFMAGSMEASPKVRDAWLGVRSRMDDAIGKFMDGTMSGDELAAQFQTLSHEMYEATAKVGYPLPFVDSDMEQSCAEAMYDEFRCQILSTAVQRNNEQGKQYVTGEMCPQRTWAYYNADYYYKSEDAIAAVTKGMDGFVQDRGWQFTVPDYRGKGLNMYANFNTAFSNNFCLDFQYILDPDMAPPEGFEWFYETGGDREKYSKYGVIESEITINPDGSQTVTQYIHRDKFDPTDYFTGTTWAAYRDGNGERHVVSKDVVFKGDKSDLFNVGGLLRFDLGDEDGALNAFLGNLQMYPKGYFSRYHRSSSFSCRI